MCSSEIRFLGPFRRSRLPEAPGPGAFFNVNEKVITRQVGYFVDVEKQKIRGWIKRLNADSSVREEEKSWEAARRLTAGCRLAQGLETFQIFVYIQGSQRPVTTWPVNATLSNNISRRLSKTKIFYDVARCLGNWDLGCALLAWAFGKSPWWGKHAIVGRLWKSAEARKRSSVHVCMMDSCLGRWKNSPSGWLLMESRTKTCAPASHWTRM